MQDHLILDVGGNGFKVSRYTLKSAEGSIFAEIETVKPLPLSTSTPTYFIDRDPKFFPIILNYLRNGDVHPSTLPDERGQLYKLEALLKIIERKLSVCQCKKELCEK
ncbi:uncharacterized protein T23G5.3-like [Saccostrea cucullata]|uniref:uncharacterized protein T23G5.3-like n=1 Tax=Saccostrea cuccullata TaxID=36930 RepID=UPI002ED6A808